MTDSNSSHFLFPDDELSTTAAERWVKEKVFVIGQYLTSYAGHLAGKVDDIIFVDLFAGNGLYSLGVKKDIFPSSAFMSLSLDLPITKFVLCEPDVERARVLKIRVNKYFRNKNVLLLEGKPEDLVDRIKMYVPGNKGSYRSATLCLCDPFSFEVPFGTIRKLVEMDFSLLIPFTFAINDRIDYQFYLTENRERLERFLGGHGIEHLERGLESNVQFYKRLIRIYENNLLSLGLNGTTSVHKLDSGLMETPVYYVGLFSKQVSTKYIQQNVDAAHHIQFELFNK